MLQSHLVDGIRREVVFFFGAGASYDFGLPLMSKFADRIQEVNQQFSTANQVSICDDFASVSKWLKDAEYPPMEWFDRENIEHLFCLWQMESEIGKPDASNKVKSLINTIAYTIEHSHELKDRQSTELSGKGYFKLLGLLADLYNTDWSRLGIANFSFITTNYDLALEYSWNCKLDEQKMQPIREKLYDRWYDSQYIGITPSQLERVRNILEEDGRRPILSQARYGLIGRSAEHLKPYPPFLKLHGSINFGICPSCGNVREFEIPFYKRTYRLGLLNELLGTPCNWHPETECLHKAKDVMEFCYRPLLIPPAWSKSGQCAALRYIWKQAAGEIACAKRVVFIGYSMPVTDVHLSYLFAASLLGREQFPPLLVVNYDKKKNEESIRARYEGLIGRKLDNHTYRYVNKPFAEAIEDIRDFLENT